MKAGIDRLLRPETIAVIGGGVWCENVVTQCREIGFTGTIWPVHPTRTSIGGLAASPDIASLPGAPDAAFIGINRERTIDAVAQLGARGAGGVVCFASGFREVEDAFGADRQDALCEAAGGMTILGPNCYGFLNYLDGAALWPDQHGGTRVKRGVALITQSSNIAINLTMQTRGLPIAYVVTVGNQAQTGMSEIAAALLRDDRVSALGLHIEGIDDVRAFEAMAGLAHELEKPVVALKVGGSDAARAGTVSHTASLAGSAAGARALLTRLGIGQASSLAVFLETLKLCHVTGPLASNRVSSMSCSGGEACLVADAAEGRALEFPALTKPQRDGLRAALGARVTLANPLDYQTDIWGDEDALSAAFTAMMQADLALGCVVLDLPRADRCDPSAWEPVVAAVARAKAATGVPMAILSTLPENLPEDFALRLVELGIVPLAGLSDAVEAMEIATALGHRRNRSEPVLLPASALACRTLTEAEAKSALATHGVRVPASARADTPCAAAEAAAQIGFPVVLKGEGIAHKTEAGAVMLNLGNSDSVSAAMRAMPGRSVLVEEMIGDGVAELLIGVVADPAHGYVLTLAAGGVMAEIMGDSTSVLVPTPREDIRAALLGLRIAPLITGYRGKPAADIEAILDTVAAVQAYVASARPQEVEINPLICAQDRAVAADALIRIGDRDA